MIVVTMVYVALTSSVTVIWVGWVKTAQLIVAVMDIATVHKALGNVTSVKVDFKQRETLILVHEVHFFESRARRKELRSTLSKTDAISSGINYPS